MARILVFAASGAVVASLALTATASAQDGMRWPGRTITYHETPKSLGVRDAARAWNRTGLGIRFKRVSSRRRADVLVKVGAKGCAGFAQLGYAPGRRALMSVLDCPRHEQLFVSAHEFGHILGLSHRDGNGCSLMSEHAFDTSCAPSLAAEEPTRAQLACVPAPADVVAAAAIYGGRPRRVDPRCR